MPGGLSNSEKNKNKKPSSPLVIVHGGAGSGKSRVIQSLSVMIQDILQQPGDNPDCPYDLLYAFTGAAAMNINGHLVFFVWIQVWFQVPLYVR